jgi:hypothetical protein
VVKESESNLRDDNPVMKDTMFRPFVIAGLLCGLACGGAFAAPFQASGTETSSASEQMLRTRVGELYNALEQGDFAKAATYLTEESKEIYRRRTHQPVQGYQVQSIKLDPGGQTATVVVLIPVFSPMAAGRPMPVPQTTHWRLLQGAWLLELPKPDPNAMKELFGGNPNKPLPPTLPPAVSQALKFDSTWCGLGYVQQGQTKTCRFTFTNVSKQVVKLAEIQTGGDYLRLKTKQREFKPGESGTLEFDFDPSSLTINIRQAFTQAMLVRTEPDNAWTKLTVAAFLVPGFAPLPKADKP